MSTRRPTTPIQRISRGSLSALSASRDPSSHPLAHLTSVFSELAIEMDILAGNFERLDVMNQSLVGFNESFASLLWGMRTNSYTADLPEGPTRINFDAGSRRHALTIASQHPPNQPFFPLLVPPSPSDEEGRAQPPPSSNPETTFVTNDDRSFDVVGGTTPGVRGRGRGAGTQGTRGRGRGRGREGKSISERKKTELANFTQKIVDKLPIKYREQQPHRQEMEKVITSLRLNPDGQQIPDILRHNADLQQHRVNLALQELVKAKHVLKITTSQGLSYQLDPGLHPPPPS